jgi:RHS repeat-associated protein
MKIPSSIIRTAVAILLGVPCLVRAQVGQNNPTGVYGVYGTIINTGCAVSPYTANATRSITDLVVPGSIGTYPLAFTRFSNSRAGAANGPFGGAGSWRHSYQWTIDPTTATSRSSVTVPASYTVNYPDGRRVIFSSHRNNDNIDFEAHVPGVSDRFEGVAGPNQQNCYLRLPDGGRVWFLATNDGGGNGPDGGPYSTTWYFKVQGIIDPYGQLTTITAAADGSLTIKEPAGRMLKTYTGTGPASDRVITRVEAWASSSQLNQTVTYTYFPYNPGSRLYSALTKVTYPAVASEPTPIATYSYQPSNIAASTGVPLLSTAEDPMYPGAMWRIGYVYQPNASGVVYGQLKSENYFNGASISNTAVTTLTVTGTNTRRETRGDGPSRTFTYTGYQLTSGTDFKGIGFSQQQDGSGFVNSVTDFNGNVTTFNNQPWTGVPLTTKYPLTPSDGGSQATSGVTYGSASCPDTNNRDDNNPYYVYTYTNRPRHHHKRGASATYLRDPNKRVTTINYPDGGSETFTYTGPGDPCPPGLVKEHRLKTGGLETYIYDSRGMLTEYRDPYHLASADPQHSSVPTQTVATLRFFYDALDRLASVKNFHNVTASYTYNARGQVLTTTGAGVVTNSYNPNGTLATTTNELSKQTSFTYDDYKRLLTTTLPPPNGGASPPPTQLAYNVNFTNTADYTHTDANARLIISPTGTTTQVAYDNNYRKTTVTVAPGSDNDAGFDQAVTSFTYDNNGNLKTIKDPNNNKSGGALVTTNYYDGQNRLTDVDDRMVNDGVVPHKNNKGHTVSFTYDQANNTLTEQRANDQVVSYQYDSMNHVHQMTVPQTPNPTATSIYDYDATGLMQVMHDSNGNLYSYDYDLLGRKIALTYPSGGGSESWAYDLAGNTRQFLNRSGKRQVFSYDWRERLQRFDWNDTPPTPSVEIGYDAASRVTQIMTENSSTDHTAITTINNIYFDDDSLQSQEEWSTTENVHRTVSYTYDTDLRRLRTYYPGTGAHNFINGYTSRGQFWYINDQTANLTPRVVGYDHNGNLTSSETDNVMWAGASYNAMDEMRSATFFFTSGSGGTRTIDYGYDEMNDRTSIRRDGVTDTFGYDLNEQVTTGPGGTYTYDANGNRTGTGFVTNNLNEQTTFNGAGVGYDGMGNVNSSSGLSYSYDAMNRLATVKQGTTTVASFVYDGLNRKISQTINGVTTYNVWDGWNLIQEYNSGSSVPNYSYVYAINGIAERIDASNNTILYLQDALGSTSHVTDASGNLIEYYKYDRFGQVTVYGPNDAVRTGGSLYDVRHLFTGQLWMPQIGLYDSRFRVYSPALMRFLQTDPISHAGDPVNLYRYCGNSGLNWADRFGLDGEQQPKKVDGQPGPAGQPDVTYSGMTPEDYIEYVNGPDNPPGGSQGPDVMVSLGSNDNNGAPGGVPGGNPNGGPGGTPGGGPGGPPGGFGSGGFNGGAGEGNSRAAGSGGSPGGGNRGGTGSSGGGSNGGGGSLFDKEWLGHQLYQYGRSHQGDIRSMVQFANVTDRAALFYTAGTLGPAGLYAGGLAVVQGGPVVWHGLTRTAPYWWAVFRITRQLQDPEDGEIFQPEPPPYEQSTFERTPRGGIIEPPPPGT